MQHVIDMAQSIQAIRRSDGLYRPRRFDGTDPLFTQAEKTLIIWVRKEATQILKEHEIYAPQLKETLPFLILMQHYKSYRLMREFLTPLVKVACERKPDAWKETEFQIKIFTALFGSITPFDACFAGLDREYPTLMLRREALELIFEMLDLLSEIFDQVPGLHVAMLAALFPEGRMKDATMFLELYASKIDFLYVSWEGRVQTFVNFVVRHCPFALELLQYAISQVGQRLDEFAAPTTQPHEQNSVFLKRDSEMNDPFSVAAILDCPDVLEYLAERMEQTISTVTLLLTHPSAKNPVELAIRHRSVNVLHFLTVHLRRTYAGVLAGMAIAFLDSRFGNELDPRCYVIQRLKGLSGASLFTEVLLANLPARRKLAYWALRPWPRKSYEKPSVCIKIVQKFEHSIEAIERHFGGAIALLPAPQFDLFVGNVISHYLRARDLRVFGDSIEAYSCVKQNNLISSSLVPENTLPPLRQERDLAVLDMFYGSHSGLIHEIMQHLKDGDDEFPASIFGSFEGYVVHLLENCRLENWFSQSIESVISFVVQSEEVEPFLLSVAYQLLDCVWMSEDRLVLREALVTRITPLMEILAPLNTLQRERKLRYASEVTLMDYFFAPTTLDTPEKIRAFWHEAMLVEFPKPPVVDYGTDDDDEVEEDKEEEDDPEAEEARNIERELDQPQKKREPAVLEKLKIKNPTVFATSRRSSLR